MNSHIKRPVGDETPQDMARLVGKSAGIIPLRGSRRWWLLVQELLGTLFLLLGLLSLPSPSTPFAGGGLNCNQSHPLPTYTVEVCLLMPLGGASLSGAEMITGTAQVIAGEDVGGRRAVFYLDTPGHNRPLASALWWLPLAMGRVVGIRCRR